MSTTAKTGIALVVILAILIIGWFIMADKDTTVVPSEIITQESVAPTPTPRLPNTAGTGMSVETDLSNEALDTDLKAINNQISELNGDNTTIDQSIKEAI